MSRNALIVGINKYQSKHLQDLKAPALDAEAIAQCLEANGDFKSRRLPEEIEGTGEKKPVVSNTHTVIVSQLKQALTTLFLPKSKQIHETALFYFSGHGLPDQDPVGVDKGFLAASDTDPNNTSSGLSLNWLQSLLSKSPIQQQIIWLDCCHSGSLLVNIGAANPGHGESKDRCFIASSRGFEESWEDLNSPYSVLTKALLDGLDPNRLQGRWINTSSLVDFVNQALKGELQTPVSSYFGEAINLTRSWQVQEESTSESQIDSGICPYKGLEFFDCNDEDPKYFFGRERLVSQLLDQVRTSNFMALVGASGNGKSSVLRAGLLHRLKLGRRISGSDQWRIRITRPDRQPMLNLALAFVEEGLSDENRAISLDKVAGLLNKGAEGLQRLVQVSSAPRTVLVIDQFEEVFTRCENPEEREQFFDCLMGALLDADNKLCLIIAMRADFIVKCMEQEYSGLARQIDQHLVSVLPMKVGELRAAICRPAEQVNLQVEPALVTEILNDIEGAPGSLPLLQYTLKILWQQRQDNQLSLASYLSLGRIQGTLDQRATEIYNEFDSAEQKTVRYIFLQLTQLGEGTEDTRRRVFQSDLIAEPKHPSQRVQQVIELLSSPENRLLVTSVVVSKSDQSTRMSIVEVAHEALIRYWKLLRKWIDKNRDLIRYQREIEYLAELWITHGQPTTYLLKGEQLKEATELFKSKSLSLQISNNANSFIKKSIKQDKRKLFQKRFIVRFSWLILLLIIIRGVDFFVYTRKVNTNLSNLTKKGTKSKRESIEFLVKGCREKRQKKWMPSFLLERFLGTCKSLEKSKLTEIKLEEINLNYVNLNFSKLNKAQLDYANLKAVELYSAELRKADLRSANLHSANLSGANLRLTNLQSTNLNMANLSNANLTQTKLQAADLQLADLSSAILLMVDFRKTNNLTKEQLEGKNPPLICLSQFKKDLDIDSNRDCDRVPDALVKNFPALTRDQVEEFILKYQREK